MRPYILDSDVFITAKNRYYAFEICPGFWDGLVRLFREGRINSIDRIRRELLAGSESEDLVMWVRHDLPAEFFASTDAEDVIGAFAEVMLWVQRNPQYLDRAVAKFATEADGWLVAYAMVHGTTVVTNEQPRPQSTTRVLLPDVCDHFQVARSDVFNMLKTLEVRFELAGSE